jgi:hypothetical protein
MLGAGTVLFPDVAGRGPGRVARNRLSRLHNSLGMKNFHLPWVPHQLADGLRQVRVAKCGELLRALEAVQRTHFRHIITSQAMRAGLTSNTSMPHNGRSLAMNGLKHEPGDPHCQVYANGWFGASMASTC